MKNDWKDPAVCTQGVGNPDTECRALFRKSLEDRGTDVLGDVAVVGYEQEQGANSTYECRRMHHLLKYKSSRPVCITKS